MNEKEVTGVAPWVWWIWGGVGFLFLIVGAGLKQHDRTPTSTAEVVFKLFPEKETPTVWVGPGTYHVLEANKPYKAISIQPDGSRVVYEMPAGRESWVGAAPAGRLRLLAQEPGTIVKIVPGK